jgi:uncharacterized protein (TIGR02001 family)
VPTRGDNKRVWRGRTLVAAVLAVFYATIAEAQFSGSVSLVSDYRFRGVSLSDGDPAAQVDVSYDGAAGWYAGAFASSVKLVAYPEINRVVLPYAGYAYRLEPDLSVDTGLSYADLGSGSEFDYAEAHVGMTTRLINLRLAFAPKYFGQDRAATYLELNSGTEVAPAWRVFGHVGMLGVRSRRQFDGRIGVRYEYETFSAQLSRVALSSISYLYPIGSTRDRSAWVLQLTKMF